MPDSYTRRQAIAAAALSTGWLVAIGCGKDASAPKASATATATATGTAAAAAADATCRLTPEMTEGPYYLAENLIRSDITEGRPGVPLRLDLTVQDAAGCAPIQDATVELWQCDAGGVYSGVQGNSGHFLRGGQKSGADGLTSFATIFPGWYQGRTTHIHVMVHAGGSKVHTGQIFFEEATKAAVYAQPPYSDRGQADMTNSSDGIYQSGGDRSTVALKRSGGGYRGAMTLVVQT
jgi:protocatechuate 3,4-dioxygenase beta subunit